MSSIKVQQSRFALLKVEDDDDDDAESKSQSSKNNQSAGAKKKNKKRKKQTHSSEKEELQSLAFGISAHHRPHSGSPNSQPSNPGHKGKKGQHKSEDQWEEWKKVDSQFATEEYEKDLQQALLQSKLEFEQQKKETPVSTSHQTNSNVDCHDSKKKSKKEKKDKPHTMSLEQFNLLDAQSSHNDELDDLSPVINVTSRVESSTNHTPGLESDTQFFEDVDSDVQKIIRKEKMQEEYQKHYAIESVMSSRYQSQINQKDKEIEFLRATVKNLETDNKQVKKRNKQLCVILSQGEMKDKAEVLMHVTQLTEVKDELTEQVTELTADLEKERSKVHSLKAELDKLKGSKHSGK